MLTLRRPNRTQASDLMLGDLPEDIVRLAFEIAAEDIPVGLECALVSKQVQAWVEPVIYRDVVVDSTGCFHRTVTASKSTKPPDFFSTRVKCLLCDARIMTPSHIPDILEKCSSARSLALWIPAAELSQRLLALLASNLLSPTHLSVGEHLFGSTFSHPIFLNLTHLNALWHEDTNPWDWSTLEELHAMTHLHVDVYFHAQQPARTARTLLSLCPPTLRVFIFGFVLPMNRSRGSAGELRAIDKGEVDPRVVLAAYSGSLEYCLEEPHNALEVSGGEIYNDWGHPSTALITLWERAEQLVQERLEVGRTMS